MKTKSLFVLVIAFVASIGYCNAQNTTKSIQPAKKFDG